VILASIVAIATKWGAPSIYDDGPQGFSVWSEGAPRAMPCGN